MFDLNRLSAREKVCLLGEPTKPAKNILKKNNPLYCDEMVEGENLTNLLSSKNLSLEKNEKKLKKRFKDKVRDFFQKFVISADNPYKSGWDFCLLIIISYNCMIICY